MSGSRVGPRRRVVVTGAASGIGQATVERLRARGCTVVGLDLNAEDDLDVVFCDVRDQASVDTAIDVALARLGGIDVLVNCAGIGVPQSAGLPPRDDALRTIDINLLGPWRVTSAALPALRAARGRVVNVASGLAYLTLPFAPAYGMSKRGLTAYSDSLRLEHGDAITVTTVYPGFIKTPIHDATSAEGLTLEGLVREESLADAVATVERAALGRATRDLATTRAGSVAYWVLRAAPRSFTDRLARAGLRRRAQRGQFDDSAMAAPWRDRLLGREPR